MSGHSYSSKVILRTDSIRKDKTALLSLQCFLNKKRKVISLNLYVKPEQFNKEEQRVITGAGMRKEHADDMNLILEQAKGKANKIFVNARLADKPLSPDEFEIEFSNPASRYDFLQFFYKQAKARSGLVTESTVRQNLATHAKLKKFRSYISFADLTYSFVEDFEKWLRTDKEEKVSANSIWKQHKTLHTFINIAIKKGYKIPDPYKNYKIRWVKKPKIHLSREEVNKLQDYYDEGKLPESQQNVLRMFLFSCYTGIRISDITRIRAEHIKDNALVFTPFKTRGVKPIHEIPLNARARKLIIVKSGPLFAQYADQVTNKFLKEAVRKAGITRKVTYHTSRHTFATLFLEMKGSVEVLQKILLHSTITTTMDYVNIVEERKKNEINVLDAL